MNQQQDQDKIPLSQQQSQSSQQSRSKLLRYGDKIYLSSTELPQMFLSARSLLEEKVYLIQELDPSLQISAYENIAENIFSIYPKLNYDAEKRYNKTIFDEMDSEEREILKRRAENEKLHNDQIIQRYQGKPVTIGSDVLIYHPLSNSFVKCSLDKQDIEQESQEEKETQNQNQQQQQKQQEYFDLKLSTTLEGSIIFKIKIDPYYTFKKDGEAITYEDQFYFQCQKLKTKIVYKKAPRINLLKTKLKFTEVISSAKRDQKNKQKQPKNSPETLSKTHPKDKQNYPPIFENSKGFQVFQAGHAKEVKHIDTFKALHIQDANSQQQQDQKAVCWGDFVRIKHILRENTTQGFLSTQINICGLSPKIFLQTRNKYEKTEKECLSGIFQVIPPQEGLMGKPIEFRHVSEQTKQVIMLRHVLTGKYLAWKDSISGNQEVTLSKSLNEIIKEDSELKEGLQRMQTNIQVCGTKPIKQNIETNGKEDKMKRFLISEEMIQCIEQGHIQSPSSRIDGISRENSDMKPIREEGSLMDNLMNKSRPEINRKTKRKQTALDFRDKNIKKKFNTYFDQQLIVINSSSSEEDYLTTNTCFSIQNVANRSLVVNEERLDPLILYINESFQKQQDFQEQQEKYPDQYEEEYTGYLEESKYIKTWLQTNPLEQSCHSLSESKDNADFFFFQPVPAEEITNLYSIYSKLYPIQLLAENPDNLKQQNLQILVSALQSFVKLTLWTCDSNENTLNAIQTQPRKERQAMLRELGIIDMILKIMDTIYYKHNYISKEMKLENTYMYKLCINMIAFLKILNYNNIYNSTYTFQWYPLFKEMITSQQVSLPPDMPIDELLKELFIQTDFSTSYEGNIKEIAQGLDFSRHNNQALNLLIGFCLYSSTRSIDSYENMIKTLFEEKEYKLFRNFTYENGELKINLEEDENVALDTKLQQNSPDLFRYIMSILVLSSEICKGGNGSLIQNYIQNIYPYDICCKAFQNQTLHPQVRALFLDLFATSYLSFDTRYFQEKSDKYTIQFQYSLSPDKQIQGIVGEKHSLFFNKYQSEKTLANNNNEDNNMGFSGQLSKINQSMNLKGFLISFLKELSNPSYKIKKYDNYLVQSVLKVINYLMTKGLLFQKSQEEIDILKQRMTDFINKEYLSLAGLTNNNEISELHSESQIQSPSHNSNHSDENQPSYPEKDTIRQGSIRGGMTPRNKGLKKTLSMKSKQGTRAHQNSSSHSNQTTELALAEPWMIEILEGLLQIEKTNQNNQVNLFFQDKKNSQIVEDLQDEKYNKILQQNTGANASFRGKTSYFSQQKSQNQQLMNQKKKLKHDLTDKITDFMKHKIENPVDEDLYQYQNFLDILTLGDNKLSKQIVKLISLVFSRNKNFLKSFNDLSFVHDSNIHDYNNLLKVQNSLLILKIDLQNIQINDQKLLNSLNPKEKGNEKTEPTLREKQDSAFNIEKELKSLKEKEEKQLYFKIHDHLLNLMKLIFFDAEDPDTNMQNELIHAENEEIHLIPLTCKESMMNMNQVQLQNLTSKNDDNNNNMSPNLNTQQQMETENFNFIKESGYQTPTAQNSQRIQLINQLNYPQPQSQTQVSAQLTERQQQQENNSKPTSNELKSKEQLTEIQGTSPRIDMSKIDPSQKKGILKNNPNVSLQQDLTNTQKKQILQANFKSGFLQKDRCICTILDQFQFDITQGYRIQDLLRNMNFHEQIVELLKYISSKIGATRDDLIGEKQLIIEKCLIFLVFFVMRNVKNQNLISEIPNFDRFISDVLALKLKNLKTYILVFISELYRDNYHLLINLHKSVEQEIQIFTRLKHKFSEELQKVQDTFTYSIYFMQLMVCFFKIKSATLLQNQQWIFKEIFQSENFDFAKHFHNTMNIALKSQKNDLNLCIKGNRIFVPDSILFLSVTLNITRQLIANQQNNQQILGAVKAFFSLNRIEECLEQLNEWYSLKLEVLQFFIEVYLQSPRQEENEIKQIRNLISFNLFFELKKYIDDFDHQDPKKNNLIFQNLTPNIFNQLTAYSTQEAIIFTRYEKAQQNYLIFGIIEALDSYLENFVNNQYFMDIPDHDADIIRKYDEILEKLGSLWKTNIQNLNPQTEQQITFLHKRAHKQAYLSISTKEMKKTLKNNQSYSPSHSLYNTPQKNKFLAFQTPQKTAFHHHNNNTQSMATSVRRNEKNLEEQKEELDFLRTSIQQRVYCIQHSDKYLEGLLQFTPSEKQSQTDQLWEKIRSRNQVIIPENLIQLHHDEEVNSLVYVLVELKKQDSSKFKEIIQNLINILTNEQNEPQIKVQTMKILRSLANYKSAKNDDMSETIHRDLCDLGFTDFLCEVITKDSNPNSKLEYFLCLCDFLDEGDFDIQKSLLNYMQKDTENTFLHSVFDFIQTNFNDFKEYEKGLKKDHDTLYMDIRSVISRKIHCCNYSFLALKLACEGHYKDMQNFIREQTINGRKSGKSIDMVQFGCQIFREYIKVINNYNIDLGEMILDYLIEVLQGPCEKNQLTLCDTKILEDIEDLIFKFSSKNINTNTLTKQELDLSGFTKRIYILLLALTEGNNDQYMLQKIGNFLNLKILYKRLIFLHYNIFKMTKKDIKKQIQDTKEKDTQNSAFKQSMFIESEMQVLHTDNKDLEDIEQEEQQQFFIETNTDVQMSEQQLDDYINQGINNLKSEAFNIYILLKSLSAASPTVKQKIKQAKRELIQTSQRDTTRTFIRFTNPNKTKTKSKESQSQSQFEPQTQPQPQPQDQNSLLTYEKIFQALKYYKSHVASIEIVNSQNEVQILYFQKLQLAKHLSSQSKQKFLETVNRDSANDKINGLLTKQEDFTEEMKHFQYWTKKIPINFNKVYNAFRSASLLIVFILNFFILFDEFTEECHECTELLLQDKQCVCDEKDYETQFKKTIDAMGFIVFLINIGSIILWAILQLSLDHKKFERQFESYLQKQKPVHKNKEKDSKKKQEELLLVFSLNYSKQDLTFQNLLVYYILKFKYFMFDSYFFYLICYQVIALGGLQISRLFFCILLLDIIDWSIILRNVIKSITVNFLQLGMTGILGVVIIFIYAMIAFYSQYVRSTMETLEYEVPICDTPMMCFMFVVNMGLRSGGGVGEPLIQPDPYRSDDYYSRFFFDLTFFLVIIIIWMNIIFGIIIDTFAALRDQKTQIDYDAKNKCFICSIERTKFEKEGLSFDNHTTKQHGVWNYLYYIVYLREKEEIDYNGTESYVAEKIKNDDISWFPIGKSLSLDMMEDSDDQKVEKLLQNIDTSMQYLLRQQQIQDKTD